MEVLFTYFQARTIRTCKLFYTLAVLAHQHVKKNSQSTTTTKFAGSLLLCRYTYHQYCKKSFDNAYPMLIVRHLFSH